MVASIAVARSSIKALLLLSSRVVTRVVYSRSFTPIFFCTVGSPCAGFRDRMFGLHTEARWPAQNFSFAFETLREVAVHNGNARMMLVVTPITAAFQKNRNAQRLKEFRRDNYERCCVC